MEDQKNKHNFIIYKKRFNWDEWMKMYIAINPNSKKPLTHMYRWVNNNGGMMEIKKTSIHSLCSKSAICNIIQHCAIKKDNQSLWIHVKTQLYKIQTHTIRRDARSLVPAARISDIVLSTGTNPPTNNTTRWNLTKPVQILNEQNYF